MAKATDNGQAVAPVKEAASQLPADLDLAYLKADAGAGVSNMDSGDVALPYLGILQGLSPQVNPGGPAYIEGAQASMFYNNVSQEVFDGRNEGILFVPCAYERKFVEWVDRDKGGGWVSDYPIDGGILEHTTKDDRGRARLANGNLIVETAYHYGLYKDPETGAWVQAVIAMKSTSLKTNRQWNNELVTTRIPGTDLIAPRWLYPYRLKTILQQKNNNSWWQFLIKREPAPVSKAVYDHAKMFHNLIEAGDVKRGAETAAPAADPDMPF